MTFENLLVEHDGAIAVITINRPKLLNALNAVTMDELRAAFLEIKGDAAIRVVVITGAGEKSFVAGADINELTVQTPASGKEFALRGQQVFDLIEKKDQITSDGQLFEAIMDVMYATRPKGVT